MSFKGFALFIFCGFFTNCACVSYTTVPGQFKKCTKPNLPYPKEPIGEIYIEMKNGNIKGNITIVKELGIQACVSYTTVPGQFKKCTKPNLPYPKEPIGEIYIEMKNGNIKGNITIVKELGIQASFQDFFFEDGKWKQSFYLKNVNCRSNFMGALSKMFGVMYNKKSCVVPKGTYFFDVDYNVVERVWRGIRQAGRMMQRVEVYTKLGTIGCFELESNVVQKKD